MRIATQTESITSKLLRVRQRLARAAGGLAPAPDVVTGMGRAAQLVFLLILGLIGTELSSGLGSVVDFVIGVLLGVALLGLASLAIGALRRLSWALPYLGLGFVTTLVAFLILLSGLAGMPPLIALILSSISLAIAATLGGSVAYLRGARAPKRRLAWGALLAASVAGAGAIYWIVQPGSDEHLAELPKPTGTALAEMASDPSEAGPYRVRTLTYGSGSDIRLPEYADAVALKTEPVDASPFLADVPGWHASLRGAYWGFGFDELPLNARVWYPEGEGPFPLVLIVHGNHNMMRASDAGYAWLGEHLASRGFIMASVDQNFLNGAPIIGDIGPENDARAWLLLEHLRLWHDWNAADGNLFAGKVDLGRVALIGHSRGGEAAAIAAAFNRLPYYPDDASVTFDYGFDIRTVVAIAPSDGQYRPADRPTPLEDVNYLVLQGGHDSDVSLFLGDRQYQRVSFSGEGPWFKASVYLHTANHGQFNTVWGRYDQVPPWAWLLNTKPLMSAEAQRQAGKVFITAFLEETLKEPSSYRAVFRDHRLGLNWLPETTYVTRYQDASFTIVSDFEEDIDLSTTSLPGGRLEGENLALWRERDIRLRGDVLRHNNAVVLGWRHDEESSVPSYTVELPPRFAAERSLEQSSKLVFNAAGASDPLPAQDSPEGDQTGTPAGAQKEPTLIDFTVTLTDATGTVGSLEISSFRPVLPSLPVRFTKLALLDSARYKNQSEPLLQTFELPLSAFVAAEPDFDPSKLRSIAFHFDRTPEGVILLDDIGFAVE